MAEKLRVGIIGASAGRGWAKISHVPAVQGIAGLELAAVATNDQKSADAAAAAFGVRGYADAGAMLRDPAVDLVAVAVKIPYHRALVLDAIAAGKPVLRMAAGPRSCRSGGAGRRRQVRGHTCGGRTANPGQSCGASRA